MAIRNPFDQVILDDPAYAEELKSDPQAGKKLVRDIYGLALGQEDPFANQRLLRELSIGLAQKEAGLPVDPNKSFVTSAERQDPVLGPALDKFNFQSMSPLEAGERTIEFILRDQEKARSKQLRGEELTFGEKILASPFMAAIDALDVLGLSALAKRGVIKASEQGIKFLDNLIQSGASKEDIAKQFVEKFPQDANNVGLSYYKSFSDENPRVVLQKDDGSGLSAARLDALKLGAEGRQEALFGSYRPVLDEYLQTNDIVSGNTFLDFLQKKNIPLNVTVDDAGNPLNKKSAINHLKKALKFLGDEKQINLVGGKYKPWMKEAEEIIKKSEEPLYPYEIKEQLNQKGLDANAGKISDWIKSGENVQDKNIVGKIKEGSIKDLNRDKQAKELKKLLDDLENNPDPDVRNKGIKQYKIKKADGTEVSLFNVYTSLAQERSPDLMEAFGRENFNRLKQLTMKPDGIIEDSFQNYIPRPQKGYDDDFKIGIKKITDAFRDGTFGRFPNFEGLMEKYGILKKTDPNYNSKTQRKNLNNLIDTLEMLDSDVEKAAYKQIYNKSVQISEYTTKKYRDTIMSSPELQQRLLSEYKKYDPDADLDKAITMTSRAFGGHLSHVYRIRDFAGKEKDFKKGMKGLGTVSQLVRSNFGIENLALQNTAENVVDTSIAAIRNALSKNDMKLVNKHLDKIKKYDELMTEKGMAAYRRLDKKNLTPQVIELINIALNKNAAGTIKKAGVEDNIQKQFNDIFIGSETPQTTQEQLMRFDNLMNYFLENPDELKVSLQNPISKQDVIDTFPETPYIRKGFLNLSGKKLRDATGFKKGGPVRMAIGGDPLQNINQQQFTPDPAMDDDFFKQAVESGNLQAFGANNLFKFFGKVPGLLTPKKVVSDVPTGTGAAPAVPNVDPGDFPFKSYFIESTTSPNAPKSALPKDWLKYYTGNIGVPQSEMKDAGIFNYLEDIEKFFPNTKLTQQNLIDVYESSPIANIEVKVKREQFAGEPPGPFGTYMGKPKHKGTGSQPLDNVGENYREIVVNVDKLPGQETPFFNASHFAKDPNVIAFTRVADYKDVDGNTVAVIQEMQTDMLTNLKKEQERMKATAEMVRNYKAKLKEQIANGETYVQDLLDRFEREYPESMLQFMETSDLVRPNDPTFAAQLTPDVVKELTEIQERITTIANQNRARVVDPDFQNKIVALQEEGRQKFNALFELNRGTNYQDQLKNIRVLDVDNTEELANYVNRNPTYMGSNEFRPVQSFPVLPFNKGKDYIDLLLKATIKDAQANGINKVAIFPSELVNKRWGKDPNGPAGKKFKTIYDNITVQELKNIAKKYTGSKNNLKIEEIVDSSKADKGIKFLNKGVDGEFQLLKDVEPRGDGNAPGNIQAFLDSEIERVALDYGPNEVVLRREIAPGQTMEYYVKTKADGFDLVPLGDADRAENATIIIEEYNPQRVKMYTLTLPEETTKQGPMFIYGKKDGGKIASDGLVSITDIFGEY